MRIPFKSDQQQNVASEPTVEVEEIRGEFTALYTEAEERRARYRLHETEYERSRHPWENNNVTVQDYGRIKQTGEKQRFNIPLNYGHALTTKNTFRVAGRLPDVLVPRLDNSRLERHRADTVEKMLAGCYRFSQAQVQFASGAHHGSLLGAGCFDVWFDVGRQMPRFRELHPGGILVVPGVDDPHDFERVYRFWTVTRASFLATYKGVELPDGGNVYDVAGDESNANLVTIVEMTDRKRRIRFAGGVKLSEYQHDYGFVPYVIIPNLGPVEKIWGYSDYEFVRDLITYFETLNNRMADVVDATAAGAMQDFGSGQKTRDLLKALREGAVIPMKKDSQGVKPVETPQFGPWIGDHYSFIHDAIREMGFAPGAAWGDIGAATSGADRALQLGPQLELTALKQIHWTRGVQRINEMLLRVIEAKQTGAARYRGTVTHGHRSTPFSIVVDAAIKEDGPPVDQPDLATDSQGNPTASDRLPMTPKALIDGDYETEVVWNNRLERDDPNFVLSEINKFQQGLQSAYTTLERLGFSNPEEELRLVAEEAEKYPWMRQGMIALIKQQMDAQNAAAGAGGQAPPPGIPISDAIGSMLGGGGGAGGALNLDALNATLNGNANSGGRGEGSVPGSPSGGA